MSFLILLDEDPDEGPSLAESIAWLEDNLEQGVRCPCCGQFAKIYKRKINTAHVRSLRKCWQMGGIRDFVHVSMLDNHEFAHLQWWGLIVEERIVRDDGGRAGFWRVTPKGVQFLTGMIMVPKYARIYDGNLLGFVDGEQVSVHEAYGTHFRLDDLMEDR